MEKIRQKDLREYIRRGWAKDLTNAASCEFPVNYTKIAYSSGVYGYNGCLIQECGTGDYYAITARCTNLFRIM